MSHHRHLPQSQTLQQRHLGSPGNAVPVLVGPASSGAGEREDILVLPKLPVERQSKGADPSKQQDVGTVLCIGVTRRREGSTDCIKQMGLAASL